MREDEYRFVAQAPDESASSEQWVQLAIRPQDESCSRLLGNVWEKMFSALRNFHDQTPDDNGPPPGWVYWKLSDWSRDKKIVDRQRFAAWAGSSLVGILNTRPDYPSQADKSKKVLYIEHIATAPGNVGTALWRNRLKYVGSALMAYAVYQSVVQGFEGHIGLHAADDSASDYYNYLRRQYQFFHEPVRGVSGTPENRGAKDRFYFESIPENALIYLDGYRHE